MFPHAMHSYGHCPKCDLPKMVKCSGWRAVYERDRKNHCD